MQLLDSCPLAEAQFASLSILLQLHLDDHIIREDSGSGRNNDVIHSNKPDTSSNKGNKNLKVEMVQCQSPNGESMMVPLYPKGMPVYYKNTHASPGPGLGTKAPATIVDVHFDDVLEPYYTIRFREDGREKQTDNAHLIPIEDDDWEENYDKDGSGEGDITAAISNAAVNSADDDSDTSYRRNASNAGMASAEVEADKSGGPSALKNDNDMRYGQVRQMKYAVLKESLTTLSPMAILPEGACKRSVDSLQRWVMEEFGMRDDFTCVGVASNDDNVANVNDDDGSSSGNKEKPSGGEDNVEDDDQPARRSNSRVRFHDDTKEGRADIPSKEQSSSLASNDNVAFVNQLTVQTYKPPSQHLNCSLGMTLFYIAVFVEDVSKYAALDGSEDGKDKKRSLLKNCAEVLLPGISLSSLIANTTSSDGQKDKTTTGSRHNKKQGGIILLTVGTTGPAYDLYGHSSVISNLPQRLRDTVTTLATLNAMPKEMDIRATNQRGAQFHVEEQLLQRAKEEEERLQQQQQWQGGVGKKKKSGKGLAGNGKSGSPDKLTLLTGATRSILFSTKVGYDAAYFRQIYVALLAALMDDEEGLLRDHDELAATAATIEMGTLGAVSSQQQQQPLEESRAGLLANQSVTSSGTVRKKLFTFSRGKKSNKKVGDYESGEMIAGREDIPEARKSDVMEEGGMDNAEIVRRTAQHLEILSIVEDDMALPKYSEDVGGRGSGSSRRGIAQSPMAAKSPRRASGGTPSTAPRFGRPPAPSDLTGFEYRPQSFHHHQPHHHHGTMYSVGGGISVSGGTTATGNSMSDDISAGTGDDTGTISSRYTTSSSLSTLSSPVPTLSKPKRDSSSKKPSSSTSRSKFLQRKRKDKKAAVVAAARGRSMAEGSPASDEGTAGVSPNKPPLHPHQHPQSLMPPQPVYDPFRIDEEEEEGDDQQDGKESHKEDSEQMEVATQSSLASGSTRDTEQNQADAEYQEGAGTKLGVSVSPPATPKEVDASPGSAQIVGTLSRSYSEEQSEGADEVSQSLPADSSVPDVSAGESLPHSPAPDEPVEPARHLDIGLALNEDLTCEYHRSKLSSLTVEGTVQVRVKSKYEGGREEQAQSDMVPPFFLMFQDHSGHIKALQENKKFVENVTHETGDNDLAKREFTYTIQVPREEEYFPVVRYKCGSSLRPVPIRVQSRVRTQGKFCRVALQISSNPQNPTDLVHLTIIMSVPPNAIGESLQCNPPGGVWNESKRVVLWCVSELGSGEKFQLQSIFEMEDEDDDAEGGGAKKELEFPVLARCQCSGAQLSDVGLEVSDVSSDLFPAVAGVSKHVVRRFRVSHKESNK